MNRVARSLMTTMAILGLVLLMPVGSVAAAHCSLTVSPRTGPTGTAFVFKGTGFTPTTLTIAHGSETPQVVDVSGSKGSSLKYSLIADAMAVGDWHVVAAGCADVASIRVTLPPTATEAAAATTAPPDDTSQLEGLTLLGVLFLAATALFLPRLTRAARAG